MKGEYVDTTTNKSSSETQNIFSKLHHHQNQQHHNPHHFHHSFPNPTNPFQLIPQTQQTSEEEDTSHTSSGQNPAAKPSDPASHPSSNDGATIEVIRRPRGRPPGSKNKPKPPVIITRDSEPPMSPYILEVPAGNDVVDAVFRFCRRKSIGLCVLSGSGAVANVTLRQPSTTPGATVTFHGRFDILSISATFLPQTPSDLPSSAVPGGFTISLAGPQGQIVGGIVAGALIAAGTVYVIGASFNNPSYHRLPVEDEAVRNSGSGDAHSPPMSGGAESGGHAQPAPSQSCGMSMYSCHLPTDVIWAPTARQPPPPPPY